MRDDLAEDEAFHDMHPTVERVALDLLVAPAAGSSLHDPRRPGELERPEGCVGIQEAADGQLVLRAGPGVVARPAASVRARLVSFE